MNNETSKQLTDEPAEGGAWLLDLVAAVDYLRRGIRPNITVWDALDESLRWMLTETDVSPDTPDEIAVAIVDAVADNPHSMITIQTAIRRWVLAMADRYNDGHHWPHPAARRGFPAPSFSQAGRGTGPFDSQ